MRDPYDVLGVSKTADAAAIKSAFRKLAKKLHPDANKNDPKAASRFAEINTAYEILGDEEKRKAFDRGEIDAEGKPKFQGFEGFGAHPGGADFGAGAGGFGRGGTTYESFSWGPEGFRRRGTRGGARREEATAGSFEDVLKDMFGGGMGAASAGRGGGFGTHFDTEDFVSAGGHDVTADVTVTLAEAASGTKKRVHLPTGKEIEVKIPAGLSEGQQIRLKGQGLAGPGAIGDALITVHLAPDSRFTLDGLNLRLDLPVTLYEAVLGAKVRVPTLDGAVTLTVPPNTSGGRVFRLKGKGMPGKGGQGDLLATIRIVLPERPDPALEELMKLWRDNNSYDPREGLE